MKGPSFKDVGDLEDLAEFFRARGIEPTEEEPLLFKLDRVHRLEVRPGRETDRDSLKRERDGLYERGDVYYQLVVDEDFTEFVFQQEYDSTRVTYDAERDYAEDTERSLLAKINGIEYEDGNSNETVERLFFAGIVDEFYEKYQEVRAAFVEEMGGDDPYAQLLLNRVIFIYFLQAKGVVPEEYLLDLYRDCLDSGGNYYDDYLLPLFFDVLNTELGKRAPGLEERFGDIPYLNGGLFSPSHGEASGYLSLPNGIWEEVFEVFERHEWTLLDEQRDESLTPSVLGHIYEKGVSQKETGSYYTPERITEHICAGTIIPRLTDLANEKFGAGYGDVREELLDKEGHAREESERVLWLYFEALKPLTVCDPACGSGAFLIAAEKLLTELYRRCFEILEGSSTPFAGELERAESYSSRGYYIKREIVTNNLYGVDIQEGCVEIARLRLWLSMISEMPDSDLGSVEPLPNIDYNIVQGNSLVGYTEMPSPEEVRRILRPGDDIASWIGGEGEGVPAALEELAELKREYRGTTDSERSEEIRGYIEENLEPLREALDEVFCRDAGIEVTEELRPEEGLDPAEAGNELLARLRRVNAGAELSHFKIDFRRPNGLDYDHLRSFDGVRAYRGRKDGQVTSAGPTSSFDWVSYNEPGRFAELVELLVGDHWAEVRCVEVDKGLGVEELRDMSPFHWCLEFGEVFGG
jgi:hypothetical protein